MANTDRWCPACLVLTRSYDRKQKCETCGTKTMTKPDGSLKASRTLGLLGDPRQQRPAQGRGKKPL